MESSQAYNITTASESALADLAQRQRRYLALMGLRTVFFVAAIFTGLAGVMWAVAVFIGAAIVIPYVAVVQANAPAKSDKPSIVATTRELGS